jgi:hypothetical protein
MLAPIVYTDQDLIVVPAALARFGKHGMHGPITTGPSPYSINVERSGLKSLYQTSKSLTQHLPAYN